MSLKAKLLLKKYKMQDAFKAWKQRVFNPCRWGNHNEVEVDHSIGNGAVRNELTGREYRVMSRASLHVCQDCHRLRGYMESEDGMSRSFFGWQLEALIRNTGMSFKPIK